MNRIVEITTFRRAPTFRNSVERPGSACSVEPTPGADFSFFRRVMESASCPILVVAGDSAARDVVYANAAFQRLSGRRACEIQVSDWTSLFEHIRGESEPRALHVAMRAGEEARATLCFRHNDGSNVWVSAVASPVRGGSGATTHYILVLHDVTDERRARQELEHRAYHDPLTGLANRHLLKDRFEQAVARARRHNTSFALVLLDMNGFKLINDGFGHDMGDELLKCVGIRLRECVRAEDTVARIGGDEFVLLLENNPSASPEALVSRVAEAAQQPMLLKGRRITPAFCAGVARYAVDGFDFETLLKAADVGLYRSKARTRRPSVSMATAALA
jgi:diguanylate cyclase (GGDEF)-like protein/PAS domain S-box-containing protein